MNDNLQKLATTSFNVTEKSLARLPRYPAYTINGDIYESNDKCLPVWKPVYKIDAGKYRDLLTAEHPRITIIKRDE